MQYKLITNRYKDLLSQEVQAYLNDGWTLYGTTNATTREKWSHFKKEGEVIIFSRAVVKNG